MRRFVRTFFVKRSGQVTVLQDSTAREFEIWRWTAQGGLVLVTKYPYADAPGAMGFVRETALAAAKRIVDEELVRTGGKPKPEREWQPAVDPTAKRLGLGPRRAGVRNRSSLGEVS